MMETGTMTGRFRFVALAAVLVVVQLGLVQHSIEHQPAHLDVACEYCAAGHTPGTPLPDVAIPAPDASAAPLQSLFAGTVLPASPARAHRARAPPSSV